MKALILWLSMSSVGLAQTGVEAKVLQSIQEMMRESSGRVTFSALHNSDRFSAEEKAFLGRLYEVFFQVPRYLKSEFEESGKPASRSQIASHFGISVASVELVLRVMQTDSRVPPLFEREPSSEITRLNLENIGAFLSSRGDQVKITSWEGQEVPSFSLPTLEGGKLGLEDLRGSSSLLYFWFSGCPPCVRIAPILAELDNTYRKDGFRIVGFNADKVLEIDVPDEQRQEYLQKSGTTYPNLELDEPTRKAFGNVNIYPTLFFVSPGGKVVRHLLNFQDRETLEGIVRQMLEDR